jgi:hypothetical protein
MDDSRDEADGRSERPPCYYRFRNLRRGVLRRSPAHICIDVMLNLLPGFRHRDRCVRSLVPVTRPDWADGNKGSFAM